MTDFDFDYAVAISFAGEDRGHAEDLARELTNMGVSVFYDDYERSLMWGKDLPKFLASVYRDRARYCVMFISQHYVTKAYPVHERQNAIDRQLKQKGEDYILPVRIDDTELPDLPSTIRYEDLRKTDAKEPARLLKEKLDVNPVSQGESHSVVPQMREDASTAGPLRGATPRGTGIRILQRLAYGDFSGVAKSIHPQKGVTLSIYAYVGAHSVWLSQEDFSDALVSPYRTYFGTQDGSGEDVHLTLPEFLGSWLRVKDIWEAHDLAISVNHVHVNSSSINNLPERFPHAVIIEAYKPSTHLIFDWRAVRIALEEDNGKWYMVALVPDMWTI